MDYKTQAIELLQLAQHEQKLWMANLSEAERLEVGSLEKWSPKDLFAHISAWCAELARSLSDADPKNLSETGEELDQANAAIFTRYHLKTWDEINKLSELAYSSVLEQTRAFSLDTFSNTQLLPWQDDLPVWRWLVGVGYMHPLIHLAQYHLSKGDYENARNIQEKATEALLRVDPNPSWQGTTRYNLACFYAQAGEAHHSVAQLRRAFLLRPELCEHSKKDPDLTSLRDMPEFITLVDKCEKADWN